MPHSGTSKHVVESLVAIMVVQELESVPDVVYHQVDTRRDYPT